MTDRFRLTSLNANMSGDRRVLGFVQSEFFTTGKLNAKMRIKSKADESAEKQPDAGKDILLNFLYKEE